MLFDQAPPDTSVYMIAGYSIFAIITVIYLASLFIRARNLRRDLDTLEGLEAEVEPPAPAVAPMPARAKPKPSKTKSAPSKASRKRTNRKR
jgi:hypothetical protein